MRPWRLPREDLPKREKLFADPVSELPRRHGSAGQGPLGLPRRCRLTRNRHQHDEAERQSRRCAVPRPGRPGRLAGRRRSRRHRLHLLERLVFKRLLGGPDERSAHEGQGDALGTVPGSGRTIRCGRLPAFRHPAARLAPGKSGIWLVLNFLRVKSPPALEIGTADGAPCDSPSQSQGK